MYFYNLYHHVFRKYPFYRGSLAGPVTANLLVLGISILHSSTFQISKERKDALKNYASEWSFTQRKELHQPAAPVLYHLKEDSPIHRRNTTNEQSAMFPNCDVKDEPAHLTNSLQNIQQENTLMPVDDSHVQSLTQPFVSKSTWSRLEGREFDHPHVVETLFQMALNLADSHNKNNEWISWKKTILPNASDVQVFLGSCCRTNADQYHGASLPMVKTRAILHNVSPKELAHFLMNSSKVHMYNKRSLGRRDVRHIPVSSGHAKIVESISQPPFPTSQPITSVTFMYARPLDNGAYLVVSRAVQKAGQDKTKSEILLGINLLEPTGENGTRMTSIMHIHAPAIPAVLAKRLGSYSAVQFVKDLRLGLQREVQGETAPFSPRNKLIPM